MIENVKRVSAFPAIVHDQDCFDFKINYNQRRSDPQINKRILIIITNTRIS